MKLQMLKVGYYRSTRLSVSAFHFEASMWNSAGALGLALAPEVTFINIYIA